MIIIEKAISDTKWANDKKYITSLNIPTNVINFGTNLKEIVKFFIDRKTIITNWKIKV